MPLPTLQLTFDAQMDLALQCVGGCCAGAVHLGVCAVAAGLSSFQTISLLPHLNSAVPYVSMPSTAAWAVGGS